MTGSRNDHEDLRLSVLRAAYRALEVLRGEAPAGPISVTITTDGSQVTFASRPGDFAAVEPVGLTQPERRVYAVLTDRPAEARAVQRLARYKSLSQVRGILSSLCSHGLAELVPHKGYRRRQESG